MCIHTHTHTHTHTSLSLYIYIYIYICVYTHILIHIYIYISRVKELTLTLASFALISHWVNPSAQECEFRITPGWPCKWHGYVHIQDNCIYKTGQIWIRYRILFFTPRIQRVGLPPYVSNRYSRIPGTQPREYEYRIPPGEHCTRQEHVHIQGDCIHKPG